MAITRVEVQRFSVVSPKSFQDVVARLEAVMGHPDVQALGKNIVAAGTHTELENVIQAVVGASGLMEFTRFDIGGVLRKYQGARARRSLRLVVGNPLIMKQMVEHVPDAASYAPVTILVDERADGVHLSYDRMTSFLSPYESAEALKVAQDLDTKLEALLTAAAG